MTQHSMLFNNLEELHYNLEELEIMAVRASSLQEIFEEAFDVVLDDTEMVLNKQNNHLNLWKKALGVYDTNALQKRLCLDGKTLADVIPYLGRVVMRAPENFPAWMKTYCELVAAVYRLDESDQQEVSADLFLHPSEPIAFEELLVPIVRMAADRLRLCAGDSIYLLTEEAQGALQRGLLRDLSDLARKSLYVDFATKRAIQPMFQVKTHLGQASNQFYKRYIHAQRKGNFKWFVKKYPVLSRLMSQRIDFWVQSSVEFLLRLQEDMVQIITIFNEGVNIGSVTNITPNLSDPHRGGRTVLALKFESGLELVYKPRSLELDHAFYGLVNWINQAGVTFSHKILKHLSRPTHGWVEFVHHQPCTTQEEITAYYHRSGSLLAIAYLLQGSDFHRGNLIAHGAYPVLIDLEVLLQPMVHPVQQVNSITKNEFMQQMHYSVLHTGLLPQWMSRENGASYDLSGIGGNDETVYRRVWGLKHMNTDMMTTGMIIEAGLEESRNNPILEGKILDPADYVEELNRGFEETYRVFISHKDDLLKPDSPIYAFEGLEVRHVYRNTSTYGILLRKTLHPDVLRSGIDRSLEFEHLSRAFLSISEYHPHWPIFLAEREAMEQQDIPYFTVFTNSQHLNLPNGQQLQNYFETKSFDRCLQFLRDLDEADLQLQQGFIQGSFLARTATHDQSQTARDLNQFVEKQYQSSKVWVDEAIQVADRLVECGIKLSDGSTVWIALGYMNKAERYRLQPLSYILFDGISGVVLYLAALDNVLGGSTKYAETVRAGLLPLRQSLRSAESRERMKRMINVGGAMGVGSIIYAFTRIGRFLKDVSFIEEAQVMAELINHDQINQDTDYEICLGTSGTILGLLTLYRETKDPLLIEKASWCAAHLLSHRTLDSVSGKKTWATLNGQMTTGFSHGAAGIAYALLQLYGVTEDPALLETAQEAYDFETSLFVPSAKNWPEFRMPDEVASVMQDRLSSTWCHGATGIGMARLGGLPWIDTEEVRQQIEGAVETTLAQTSTAQDHLCCGHAGRSAFLLEAGRRLNRIEWVEAAHRRTAQMIERAHAQGGYGVIGQDAGYSPGFFQGMSGIGYALLRQAYPDRLPEVLLWD